MSNETLKRINALLKTFSDTFEIEANLIKEGDEMVAAGLRVKDIKNDGSEFISNFHDTFNSIVQSISEDHEVIYDEQRGLVVARKVVKTEYIIDDI